MRGADNNNAFFGQTVGRTGSGRAPYQFSQEAEHDSTDRDSRSDGAVQALIAMLCVLVGRVDYEARGRPS